MKCPIHQDTDLEKIVFYKTQIDFCPDCLGMFFNQDELRTIKDDKDENLQWLDIDL